MVAQDLEAELQAIIQETIQHAGLVAGDLPITEIPGWGSLNHVRVMIAIEKKFGLRFAGREVASVRTFNDLVRLVERKTA